MGLTVQDIRSLLQKPVKQASIQGIAAGAKATGRIPTNGTIYILMLRCLKAAGVEMSRAEMVADIGNIIVRLNGKQVMEGTSTFFLDRQKYYGDCYGASAGNVNGVIPIFLYLPHLESDPERRVLGYGMQDVEAFEIEVNITAVATLVSMEVYTVGSDEVRPLGRHLRIRPFQQNFGTTGLQEISTLPREKGNVDYVALHIEKSTGTIDKVTVKVNNNIVHDQVPPSLNQVMLAISQRIPQAAYYTVDFGRRNDLTSILPMAGVDDFRQEITWSAAAPVNFKVYAEMLYNGITA